MANVCSKSQCSELNKLKFKCLFKLYRTSYFGLDGFSTHDNKVLKKPVIVHASSKEEAETAAINVVEQDDDIQQLLKDYSSKNKKYSYKLQGPCSEIPAVVDQDIDQFGNHLQDKKKLTAMFGELDLALYEELPDRPNGIRFSHQSCLLEDSYGRPITDLKFIRHMAAREEVMTFHINPAAGKVLENLNNTLDHISSLQSLQDHNNNLALIQQNLNALALQDFDGVPLQSLETVLAGQVNTLFIRFKKVFDSWNEIDRPTRYMSDCKHVIRKYREALGPLVERLKGRCQCKPPTGVDKLVDKLSPK